MFEGLIIGLYIPGSSHLHKLDPRTKLIGLILFIILLFLQTSYLIIALNTVFLGLLLIMAKVPLKSFLKGLKPILFFASLTLLIHLFFTPGSTLLSFGKITITSEGAYRGGLMATRLVLLIGYSTILTLTTSPIQLTYGLEKILNPLSKAGIPVTQFAMMVSIALRFLPTLALEADKIIKAQVSRGAQLNEGSLIKRGYSLVPIIVPLFVSTFRRAEELAVAMETRCYGGGKRTRMYELSFKRVDYMAFGVMVVYLAMFFALQCILLI